MNVILSRPEDSSMRKAIVEYMQRSGLVPQSVEAMLKHVARWERRLREMGIESVPRRPGEGPARAENMLNLLIRQSARMRNAHVEHQLRNLTEIRPYKL